MYQTLRAIWTANQQREQRGEAQEKVTVVLRNGTTYRHMSLVDTRTNVTKLSKELELGTVHHVELETTEIAAVERIVS